MSNFINKLPYVRELYQGLNFKKNSCYPAGHYHSPIISVDDISKREDEIWDDTKKDGIVGIELETEKQLTLINSFKKYYNEIPFTAIKENNKRYQFENRFYSYGDGIILYSMMRHFQPKQIVEIGSGFSSSMMLDTNELFFDNQIKLTFIEPYPERLYELINEKDKKCATIIQSDVQLVSMDHFENLKKGDILFVDSSHIVKTGSDVNYILFEILPRLQSGVLIHFHDVFYPFEYPKDWVLGGRNWNEDYFLKAFLMYNDKFQIKLFSEYLHTHHKEAFSDMPLCYKNRGGNIWIEKK